jgi:hypothetical protein
MANSDGCTTPESLGRQVRDNVQAGCKDVFLYLSGHGQPGAGKNKTGVASGKPVLTTALKGGPAAVITGRLGIVSGDGTPDALLDGDKVTPDDLEAILDAHPTIEFKIKIDSCFSGRFSEPLKRHRNLRVLELSTAANEVGYQFQGPIARAEGRRREDPADQGEPPRQPGRRLVLHEREPARALQVGARSGTRTGRLRHRSAHQLS